MKLQDNMIRKAAILVSSLEPELAQSLVGQFAPGQMALVRQAIVDLDDVDAEERAAVIDEFFAMHNGTDSSKGRDMLDDPALVRSDESSSLSSYSEGGVEWAGPTSVNEEYLATIEVADAPRQSTCNSDKPFQFLAGADSHSLVPFLRGERPQTVAVVLSYLAEGQAAQVMSKLPVPQQVEVMERLADLDETDDESLRVVERQLEEWVEEQRRRHQRQAAGLAAVRGILSQVSAADEQAIMKSLEKKQSPLAQAITGEAIPASEHDIARPSALRSHTDIVSTAESGLPQEMPTIEVTWDDMADLDSASWAEVVREADPALVVLALAGGSDALFSRATRYLTKHDADALGHERSHLGPTRLSDVSIAQDELAALATTLQRRKRQLAGSNS